MTSNSQSVCPQDALTDPAVIPIDQIAELLAKFPPEVLALFQEVEAEITEAESSLPLCMMASSAQNPASDFVERNSRAQGHADPEIASGKV